MDRAKFNWRALKTLSNYAFVVVILILVLNWYNYDQIELVVNDPIAKAYWLQVRRLYERIGWISLALTIALRITYWTIEYVQDRRVAAASKGD